MEKKTESILTNIVGNDNIYYTPIENIILRQLFKCASKKNTKNMGFPDRIYYNDTLKLLIIYECKHKVKDINKCLDDLQKYINNICFDTRDKHLEFIVGVAFCGCDKDLLKWDVELYKQCNDWNKENILPLSVSPLDIIKVLKLDLKSDLNIHKQKMSMSKLIHKLHNDIRDNCALSDTDKPLLVSAILLSLMDSSTLDIINNTTEDIGVLVLAKIRKILIKNNVEDVDSMLKYYNFLATHSSFQNNDLLRKMIIDIQMNIVSQDLDYDILNEFYTEFVSYNSLDSKSLGIVLTPPHIIKLMVHVAQIEKNDIVLDLCTGTGSFCWESMKKGSSIVACEYQDKLFNMLFTNNLVRNGERNILHKGDCFTIDFVKYGCTKSIINPPFGSKTINRKELDFVFKQLESVKEGGKVVAIFPIGCLFSSQKKLRSKLTNIARVETIIELSDKVFYPTALIKCCIVVLSKTCPHDFNNDKVLFVNFENDGYEVEKQVGRVCKNYESLSSIINIIDNRIESDISYLSFINPTKDWKYNKVVEHDEAMVWSGVLDNIKQEYINSINNICISQSAKNMHFENIKIKDLFTLSTSNKIIKNTKDGEYPLISSSGNNNGIAKYIDSYSFEEGNLTISKNGNVGVCFYHPYKFSTTSDVFVLSCKTNILTKEDLKTVHIYITNNITKKFSNTKYKWSYKLTDERINDEYITLPILNGVIDKDYICKTIQEMEKSLCENIRKNLNYK